MAIKRTASAGTVVLLQDERHRRGRRRRGKAWGRGSGNELAPIAVDIDPAELAAHRSRASGLRGRDLRELDNGGSTLYRCRRQLAPLGIAAGVFTIGAIMWLVVGWLPHSAPWIYASAATAVLAGAGICWATVNRRWRPRATLAAISSGLWVMATVSYGPTWTTIGALLVMTVVLSARWWQAHRPGYPTGPPEKPAPAGVPRRASRDDVPGTFTQNLAGKGGLLEGAYLTKPDRSDGVEDTEHATSWTVELVPGRQSIATVRTNMERFLSGLRRAQEEVIVEPHPSRDSARLRLTVVTNSPITETVPFTGPTYMHEGKHGWIEPAWYADGAGRVQVPVYAPNSARHLTLIGGQGSGKSALLNQLALSLMASGYTCVWYLDGQDGASSPQLMRFADWAPTGEDREQTMLAALEALFAKRERRMKQLRRSGLTPSTEYPGLVVIIDEFHEFWRADSRHLARWIKLDRIARKLCVGFWAATQHPSLESFGGSDTLRSLLMQYTTLVLRTKGTVSKNILQMAQDPATLPTLPGYGYVLSGDGTSREAPFRADFLDDEEPDDGGPVPADTWFAQYPCPTLNPAEQNVLGPAYLDRVAIAERKYRDLDNDDEHPGPAEPAGMSVDDETDAEICPVTSSLGPPRFPRPALVPTQRSTEQTRTDSAGVLAGMTGPAAAVYAAVANGASTRSDLETATGLAKTRLYEVLTDLRADGHITKQGHGRYTLTDAPDDRDDQPHNDSLPAGDRHRSNDDRGDLTDEESATLAALRAGHTTKQALHEVTGLTFPGLTKALDELIDHGAVQSPTRGLYRITEITDKGEPTP